MKRLFGSFVLMLAIMVSCSEIPENNDPVIGIWAQTSAPKDTGAKHLERVEWFFNDAYLGRYHKYEGPEITISTDFPWEDRGAVYIIRYPGIQKVDDVVRIKQTADGTLLVDQEGNVLAIRE